MPTSNNTDLKTEQSERISRTFSGLSNQVKEAMRTSNSLLRDAGYGRNFNLVMEIDKDNLKPEREGPGQQQNSKSTFKLQSTDSKSESENFNQNPNKNLNTASQQQYQACNSNAIALQRRLLQCSDSNSVQSQFESAARPIDQKSLREQIVNKRRLNIKTQQEISQQSDTKTQTKSQFQEKHDMSQNNLNHSDNENANRKRLFAPVVFFDDTLNIPSQENGSESDHQKYNDQLLKDNQLKLSADQYETQNHIQSDDQVSEQIQSKNLKSIYRNARLPSDFQSDLGQNMPVATVLTDSETSKFDKQNSDTKTKSKTDSESDSEPQTVPTKSESNTVTVTDDINNNIDDNITSNSKIATATVSPNLFYKTKNMNDSDKPKNLNTRNHQKFDSNLKIGSTTRTATKIKSDSESESQDRALSNSRFSTMNESSIAGAVGMRLMLQDSDSSALESSDAKIKNKFLKIARLLMQIEKSGIRKSNGRYYEYD